MEWQKLLTPRRLRRGDVTGSSIRSAFQQDADLIVFSAAFRRLQDKTQVQPLNESGRVRTRLTHSIEVASVGRSLGSAVAHALAERGKLDLAQGHAMASIVYAACLAHDIGNPPFGHAGEEAVQTWFAAHPEYLAALTPAQAAGLLAFDGNAQGFRTLTQLENYRFDGGLRLTCATLGAFMKYTRSAYARTEGGLAQRKPGYFEAEQAYVDEILVHTGVTPGTRHPLVYLTEAADDICYAIVDLEDGFDAGLLDHADAVAVLSELAGRAPEPGLGRAEQLHKLRALAIGRMVDAVSEAFVEAEPSLLRGESVPELCALTELGSVLAQAKALAAERIFAAPSVVERLLGGQRVLEALLEQLVPAVSALGEVGFDRARLRGRARSMVQLLGETYRPQDPYQALLGVTDFLCALTDRAAVALSRRLSGEA